MRLSPAHYLLPLLPALVLGARQDYEELEKQLKEVFKERSNILHQLTKTSRELDGIKVNLQSLKNDERSSKSDVEKLLEIGQRQREQMKSLQEVLQNQLKETSERAEKQQATINFLKTDMERKSKMIRDLQNENKSLKNKLLSGSKLCGIHAEESFAMTTKCQNEDSGVDHKPQETNPIIGSPCKAGKLLHVFLSGGGRGVLLVNPDLIKKIQAQLKELRYGKKDLLFKAQQLTELERKLAVAKNELEKAALDRDSQLKAMKETVHLCLSTVFRNQPPPLSLTRSNPTQMPVPPGSVGPLISDASRMQPPQTFPGRNESFQIETTREENPSTTECNSQNLLQEGRTCLMKPKDNQSSSVTIEPATTPKKLQMPPCTECEVKKTPEKQLTSFDGRATREKKYCKYQETVLKTFIYDCLHTLFQPQA